VPPGKNCCYQLLYSALASLAIADDAPYFRSSGSRGRGEWRRAEEVKGERGRQLGYKRDVKRKSVGLKVLFDAFLS
jgi:hypothetical protein